LHHNLYHMLQGATKASLADRIKGALHLGADNEVSPKKEHYTGETYDSPNVDHNPLITHKGIGAQGKNPEATANSGTTTSTTSSLPATTNNSKVLSSSMGAEVSRGVQGLGDREGLLSSDDHWAKAQAATEEARRQAKIVEAGARSHREAYEEYYKAERHVNQSKRTVEEIETRISALNLDAKRARAKAARETYERQKNSMSGLAADADKARSEADKIQDVVNSKGRDLEGLVAASKLHSDRLAALEAELAELRAAEQDARQRHTTHIATIDPLKAKHAHHKAERSRVSDALNKLRAELDALRNKEGEAQRTLDAHQGEYSSLEAELAELEASRAEKERTLLARQQEMDNVARQHGELSALLGQHRDTVGEMTKNTQAAMADAQAKAEAADRQAAELARAQQAVAGHEQAVGASREALTGAVAEQRELEQGQRGAAEAVESHAQRASRLQAELLAAKEKVDLAQAKKEELWELSKREGELADEVSDVHYVEHVARPAGEDPSQLVNKTNLTADIAGKTTYGQSHAIDHQSSAQL